MSNIGSITRQIKNSECFEKWLSARPQDKIETVFKWLIFSYGLAESPQFIKNSMRKTAGFFSMRAGSYWKASNRKSAIMNKKYQTWLDNYIVFEAVVKDYILGNQSVGTSSDTQIKKGRPKTSFSNISLASKKRRVLDLVETRDTDELQFAAKWSLNKSPDKSSHVENSSLLSPTDALALYIDLDLSYRKYNRLREVINSIHPNTLPSYYTIMKVRDELLPNTISATETVAEVNLQDLLNKTAESIVKTVEKENSIITAGSSLNLICKWGFDGSSGHSTYKQKFYAAESTDEYLFLTALVPIRLVGVDHSIMWQNKTPSSTYFCRPLRLSFTKENGDVIMDEESRVTQSINNLQSCVVKLQEPCKIVTISYEMIFTMIDGAVCHKLSGISSTQTCYICGATPKMMNSSSVSDKIPNTERYKYGLSTLHNWIRSFEFLLHVAYRLPLKCWQVRGEAQKTIFNDNKQRIQREFKQKMGLIVDKPKPGFGSTNDGNTARTFFRNSAVSSEITGIDHSLIEKFYTINRMISSGLTINMARFKGLLKETNDLYLSLYSWYNIPTSIHKVLVHSPELIESFNLPIGQLSEDALEGRHKDARKYRESHTRKTSRSHTNKDLITILLLTSDPLISTIRSRNKQKKDIEDPVLNEYFNLE